MQIVWRSITPFGVRILVLQVYNNCYYHHRHILILVLVQTVSTSPCPNLTSDLQFTRARVADPRLYLDMAAARFMYVNKRHEPDVTVLCICHHYCHASSLTPRLSKAMCTLGSDAAHN